MPTGPRRPLGLGRIAPLAAALAASGCAERSTAPDDATPLPRGDRLLAIDVTPAQDGSYDNAFRIARSAGMQVVGLFLQWDVLEPTAGTYDDSLPTIANAYYPAAGVSLDVTVAPINTTRKVVPSDLLGREFDDPVVIERFRRVLDRLLDRLPDVRLHSLNVGSEMDVLFGSDAEAWRHFKAFYEAAASHLKARRPDLPVTVEATFSGITGPSRELVRSLNERSEAIAVSYYPEDANGNMPDPSVVASDFRALTEAYPGRPIYLLQFGYATSPGVGGSEARQAEFVRQAFLAWDRHAGQVKLIDFTWRHDSDPAEVARLVAFYCGANPACNADAKFAAFLGSLGLRTWTGQDKAGFVALKREAAARGW